MNRLVLFALSCFVFRRFSRRRRSPATETGREKSMPETFTWSFISLKWTVGKITGSRPDLP